MSVKLEGPLTKWTNVVQGWQFRWFVLDDQTGLLSYFTSKDKMMRGARRGCLRLRAAKIGIDDEDDSTFTITSDHKTFHFQASNSVERSTWVKALEETIIRHSQGLPPEFSIPTEEELNARLQEAEAYFRILTQQVKNMESHINSPTTVKNERNEILKDSLTTPFDVALLTSMPKSSTFWVALIQKLKQMIETMGQTIELLHNAKSALAKKVPVPILHGKPTTPTVSSRPVKKISDGSGSVSDTEIIATPPPTKYVEEHPGFVDKSVKENLLLDLDNTGQQELVEVAQELNESAFDNEGQTSGALDADFAHLSIGDEAVPYVVPTVPLTSFSSSDEEDLEFFDAENEFQQITVDEVEKSLNLESSMKLEQQKSEEKCDENALIDLNVLETSTPRSPTSSVASEQYSSILRDSEYDNEDDNEDDGDGNEDMQSHGSVITHLLSQVKIGMDLTKVTLPTFILERRSLLEMYADFFAHPDLFKGIPPLTDAGDRMVQVLKWYLSSFHAGRKGSVAKKPYNPILGEVFQCFYDLTDDGSSKDAQERLSREGPVPWATKEDVSFIAEQVSHHPPISAFYAECENKRVCFNCSIWTKSKFLGLSIGVHMVGTGNVYVMDHDEEYVMTFPNGYGRSILTVPWVELGGRTEISCPRSGYNAQVEFHTKPFYGGKRNRLTAEVFAPNQKKPFMTVTGEWNGIMYAKYANAKEPEVFIDTHTMPTIKKKVKAIDRQEEFESRRMWRDVTVALKGNQIENATESKHKLEEKQRSDARVRKETNTRWINRMFDEFEPDNPEARHFVYKQPLYRRLGCPKPGCQN